MNVIDSDATVIFTFGKPDGGIARTVEFYRSEGKPLLIIDAGDCSVADAAKVVQAFLVAHDVQVLNVAGPRASKQPTIYRYVSDVMLIVLDLSSDSFIKG